jgi:hypothetical protein
MKFAGIAKFAKFAILQSLQRAQKSPGEPGRVKVIPKINRRMDFRFPGKHLHQLQLRGTACTQILHRINNRVCHQKANNKLLSLF